MAEAETFEAVRLGLLQPERGLYFAPIRHHSPACAWAVRELIREVQPRQVLVEAPVDLLAHLDTILSPETRPPVAIAVLVEQESASKLVSYYPFCAHSPEYIALAEGRAIGAEVRFIDMPAANKALTGLADPGETLVLSDEAYFDSGDYVAALCRRLGCRDGYELWDHLFESRLGAADWRGFLSDVGVYCAALREATSPQQIERGGDAAREAHMAAGLRDALAEGGPVVVVAGGFHVPVLIEAAQGDVAPPPADESPTSHSYLIRYSFEALDALSGYAAGLPQPGYYDYLWRRANDSEGRLPWREAAIDLVSEFCASQRAEGHGVSVPAQVEMLRAAESLAAMRGRAGAARHDLIDAVRTALVKGEVGVREVWTERLVSFLGGTAIGDVPASAGSPPLVEDARRRARAVRVDVTDGARRRRRLDIRRKPSQLAASRYFHAMRLLDTGFCERDSGPDFVNNVGTERLFEEWSYAWSPHVEGRLIELSARADRLPAACLHLIESARSDMQAEGQARDVAGMTRLFVAGLLAGLGRELEPFLGDLSLDIQTHGDFAAVAQALRRMYNIARSAGPLSLPPELSLDAVCQAAYQRLVFLCDDLPNTPADSVAGRMEALRLVAEMLREDEDGGFDRQQFDDAIDRVAAARPPPQLLGAVLALCVQSNYRGVAELCAVMTGSFTGSVDAPEDRIGVLRGILFIAPELVWRHEQLLAAIDQLLRELSDEEFLELLPHIRLAFTALNPRETDRVADMLVRMHGGQSGQYVSYRHDLDEADLAQGLEMEQGLREAIDADGLALWLEGSG